MIKEFKEFALRGNVIDMAVGIVIGAAFGKIVSSLVEDVIMPPVGLLLGQVDFSKLELILRQATPESAAVVIRYGLFINNIISFLIIALAIFLTINQLSKLKKKEEVKVANKKCPYCCNAIPIEAKKCGFCTSEVA